MMHTETTDSVELLRSRYWEFYNPMYSAEHNLDMAVGGIHWRDQVITNLRRQIADLERHLNRGEQ